MKLFFGLCGVESDGTLYTPSGKRVVKLPPRLAFKIQAILNDYFADVGMVR